MQTIPYIKTGQWNYYNSEGRIWKAIRFINKNIPITTQILLVDPEKNDETRLIVSLKDHLDEWVEEK